MLMDMHMTGFKSIWSEDLYCLYLFNTGWEVKHKAGFMGACALLYMMGVGSELIGRVRRELRLVSYGHQPPLPTRTHIRAYTHTHTHTHTRS